MIYIEWRPFWRQKVKMAPNIKNGAKSQFLVEIFKINKKAAETVLPTSQYILSHIIYIIILYLYISSIYAYYLII